MNAEIHPTAMIARGARIGAGVSVGAYSIIGENVVIGEGTRVGPHVVIDGHTSIGRGNRIFQFSSLGGPPQDKKYSGEPTKLEIGDGNVIREYVTINRGTAQDAGVTRVGDENWIMAYVHFAHDCQIGDNTVFANACELAGHVRVGDWAILGATTLVHQFVRIGECSFTGMGTFLDRDLPPYVKAAGNMAKPYGINSVGLRRRGFSDETIHALKRAYRTIYRAGLGRDEVMRELRDQSAECAEVARLADFLDHSERGIIH
ncbi:MAG: acyl-ACP--UDP-N-acetylglucosamine O-acyltransferase [Betaproteobacteria bacterium]|nr:acyl-ACP--UDP-N-acetylglucosamine O-acyltransferase [Betaproteobacteria bacterium]